MVLILYIILVGVFASGFYLGTMTKNNDNRKYNSLVPISSKNESDNIRKKRKLAEAIYNSIITGYELDCSIGTDNYGMAARTFFLEDGEWITLNNEEFSEIYEEVWKKLT